MIQLNFIIIYILFISSSVILSVNAIKCYQCNSHDDPKCITLSEHLPHEIDVYYKECEGEFKGMQPFCRKIDILIVESKHKRVERTCGYERSKYPCYNADNDFHFETVCQCFNDGCNGSNRKSIFSIGIIILLGSFAYYLSN